MGVSSKRDQAKWIPVRRPGARQPKAFAAKPGAQIMNTVFTKRRAAVKD
jgi:hypothetical protein